jgi:hypothetical protein
LPPPVFAFQAVWPYLVTVNKYSPLVSEFGSAEEEAAYNQWFRKKVEEALADPRPPVPHDEVMAEMRAIIDEAKAREKKY